LGAGFGAGVVVVCSAGSVVDVVGAGSGTATTGGVESCAVVVVVEPAVASGAVVVVDPAAGAGAVAAGGGGGDVKSWAAKPPVNSSIAALKNRKSNFQGRGNMLGDLLLERSAGEFGSPPGGPAALRVT
jgi:hypothetical protein